jgi:hypothetical protein
MSSSLFTALQLTEPEHWDRQIALNLDGVWREQRKARLYTLLGMRRKAAAIHEEAAITREIGYRMAACPHNPHNGGAGQRTTPLETADCAVCGCRVYRDSLVGWLHLGDNPVSGNLSAHQPAPAEAA